MKLHPFQADLIRKSVDAMRTHQRVIMQLGTGGGKTACASWMIKKRLEVRPESKIAFVAPLEEILEDTCARLNRYGVDAAIFQSGRKGREASVQVASLMTLAAIIRTPGQSVPPFDWIILDECHHAPAASTRAVLDAYVESKVLGLTATPERGDGVALGDSFDHMVVGPSNAWLTEHGYLVPCELVGPMAPEKGLVCNPCQAYARWSPSTKAIVFCRTIAEAKRFSNEFVLNNICAIPLHGSTSRKSRRTAREQVERGEVKVLCVAGLAWEGFDCPALETAIFACKVGTIGRWLQGIGRVSRTAPGKHRCTVIDLCGSWIDNGLRDDKRVWSLTGRPVTNAENMPALQRCKLCQAVFAPAPRCPRCGAEPLHIERALKVSGREVALAVVSNLSQAERDKRYLDKLRTIAVTKLHRIGSDADGWALVQFVRRFKRQPEAA